MKIIKNLTLAIAFLLILALIIAYARGYRLDLYKKSLTPTGILSIYSNQKAAKIYINGELKGVTDININLPPGKYHVEIKKEGYTSWRKTVKLKGELVLTLEATLFPLTPSLSPLTNLGIVKAVAIDAAEKILLFSQDSNQEKDGIYLYETNKKPINFFSPLKLIILKKNLTENVDFTRSEVYFSPDYSQTIIEFSLLGSSNKKVDKVAYLLSLNEENKQPFDVTTSKETLLEAWVKEKENQNLKILETYPKDFFKVATESFKILSFSPNETKIFYQAKKSLTLPLIINPPLISTNQTEQTRKIKKDSYYVYDKKEDKNYEIIISNKEITNLQKITWLPDSKHLIYIESNNSIQNTNSKKKIVVIGYDGTNKQTVYSGPFEDLFFATTSEGNLIVLANLNPETNKWPDLYAVGIK